MSEEAKNRYTVDHVITDHGAMSRATGLIATRDHLDNVSVASQVLRDLGTPQLIPTVVVRRIEIADDKNSHEDGFSPMVTSR
jgi:hypothetical protein